VLIASSEKIRRELGWTPKYSSLEQIVETAWTWHVANPNGYAEQGNGFRTFENHFSQLSLPSQGKNLLLNDSRRLVAWNVIGTCPVHWVECKLQLAAHSILNRCGSCKLNAIKHRVRQVRWCSRPRRIRATRRLVNILTVRGLPDRICWASPVLIRLAVLTIYGELRFLVLPLLSWVPAERVELLPLIS
jgi:hypothetical protein